MLQCTGPQWHMSLACDAFKMISLFHLYARALAAAAVTVMEHLLGANVDVANKY